MNTRELLDKVKAGEISPEDAEVMLKAAPFVDLGYAKADTHRKIRQGTPEVIFGAGKTPEQSLGIARALADAGTECILVTRCPEETVDLLRNNFDKIDFDKTSRLCVIGTPPQPSPNSAVCVVSAGTSDMPVAEEAARTAEALGSRVTRIYDAGVSGLHRILSHTDELMRARALVVVAGMEGALASVVGGLVEAPVIAVPTSVGYGASFGGVTALLSMMNSCSSDVSVVNIDNGFGAGYIASMIDRRSSPL
jgi:NCAIR mutase (PurE)-related protein